MTALYGPRLSQINMHKTGLLRSSVRFNQLIIYGLIGGFAYY